jgi:hypothetical protein
VASIAWADTADTAADAKAKASWIACLGQFSQFRLMIGFFSVYGDS